MNSLDRFKRCFEPRRLLPLPPTGQQVSINLRGDQPASKFTPETAKPPPGEPWDAARLEFDPALKHFANGWRSGAPDLAPEVHDRWREAHAEFMAHVLEQVGGSDLSEQLVLRGSSAMPFWVGDAAREPKDLDFVVRPASVKIDSRAAKRLRKRLRALVERAAPQGITVMPDATAVSDIWTYDRVPGQRIVFTWRSLDLPWAQTQVDLVFRETLPESPRRIRDLGLLVAGPELSLVWKILWLYTDMHPQAKDLYDAMVLAERHPLRIELLREVFRLERGEIVLPHMVNTWLEWVGVDGRAPDSASGQEHARTWWNRLFEAAPRLADPTPL